MIHLKSAVLVDSNQITIIFDGNIPKNKCDQIQLLPDGKIQSYDLQNNKLILHTSVIDIRNIPVLYVPGLGNFEIAIHQYLDKYITAKAMGLTKNASQWVFRLFAPRAIEVHLNLYKNFDDEEKAVHAMQSDNDGVWEYRILDKQQYQFYTYSVINPEEKTNPEIEIGDPYSKAVVTQNNYLHAAKSFLYPADQFDWEEDTWIPRKTDDLIIYEMHVRDMTQHPSSEIDPVKRGTYLGLTEKNKKGGLSYIKSLGINAVELLPVQEFSNIEPEYQNKKSKYYNRWNPYAFNHWGYMTSYFMAPES